MDSRTSERVLSIQSHVASGYVGGKAAVFPLQLLGYDVDVVNTVHFSNHAGYGRAGGTKATAKELEAVFDGLEENELIRPTRLLTGYTANSDGLSAIAQLAKKLRAERPELIYLLDPVMGDDGRMYVAPDVIPLYRKMLPLATIISPNWFEVEILTDTTLTDLASLRRALEILHKHYSVPNIVITSIQLPAKPWLLEALPEGIRPENSDHLLCITSSVCTPPTSAAFSVVHAQCIPLISGYFSGVGDLFSALLLGHYRVLPVDACSSTLSITNGTSASVSSCSSAHASLTNEQKQTPLSVATARAIATTHSILCKTHAQAVALPESERLPTDDEADVRTPLRRARRMRGRELRLVQNQDILRGTGLCVRPMTAWEEFWDVS